MSDKSVTMTEEEFAKLMKQKAKEPRKPKKVAPGSPPVVDPMAGAIHHGAEVARAVHVYQRKDEPDSSVRMNSIREVRSSGPGTIVFEHHHGFGWECVTACKSRVFDE